MLFAIPYAGKNKIFAPVALIPPIETVPVTFGAANEMLHVVTVAVSVLTTHDGLTPDTPPETS